MFDRDVVWFWIIIIVVFGALGYAMSESNKRDKVAKEKFMTACQQDHKEYECTAI